MKTYHSPCVAMLDSLAEATAETYDEGAGVVIEVDRARCAGILQIRLGKAGQMAIAHIENVEQVDELLRELLVLKADLLKIMHKKDAS